MPRTPTVLALALGACAGELPCEDPAFGTLPCDAAFALEIGEDPLVNDPRIFYDILLRRRNWANASFCCGAGSIHRREASGS